MNDEISRIIAMLEDAFGDLGEPADNEIVYDNSGLNLECDEIRVKFRRRHWRNLSSQDLEGQGEALYFFTPEAFRFFLPAFIRAALLDPVGADIITDSILNSLARPDLTTWWKDQGESISESFRVRGISETALLNIANQEVTSYPSTGTALRVAALDGRQRGAVLAFVAFLRAHRPEEFIFEQLNLVEQALQERNSQQTTR